MQDETQILANCREACDRLIDRNRSAEQPFEIDSAAVEKVRETTTILESELRIPSDRVSKRRLRFNFLKHLFHVRRIGWLLIYAATVLGIIWWYEVRPVRQAHRQLQGSWQFTEGFGHQEVLDDVYFHVDGSDTWLTYPHRSDWVAAKSRISLRRAEDFFVVHREYELRNTYETEYIVRLAGDRLYRLRGMEKLDPMKERKTDKLRRIEELPPEAIAKIESSN